MLLCCFSTRFVPLTCLAWTMLGSCVVPVQADDAASPQIVTRQASDILRGHAIDQDVYTIQETVEVHEDRYLFHVETEHLEFAALGLPMLEMRLRETQAISQARGLVTDPLILKGAVEIARATPGGARKLLTDPLGSLTRIPTNIKHTVDALVDPLDRRAGGPVRRQLAVSLGADPETRNRILARLLDHLATRKTVGRLAAQVGLGTVVPGLGLLAINRDLQQKLIALGPRKLAEEIEQRLVALEVDAEIAKEFAQGRMLTSSEKLLLTADAESLQGVAGLSERIRSAAGVETEYDVLTELELMRELARLHAQYPCTAIHNGPHLTLELGKGPVVLLLAADYLLPSTRLQQAIETARVAYPERPLQLRVTGEVSTEAGQLLQKANVELLHRATSVKR